MRMKEGSGRRASVAVESEIPATEDKELVLAFKRGEDGSYQAIYERYSPRVSGICRRMLNQAQDAEEAQQETFMRVYTSLPKFNGRYQLGAWVSRIATNVCLDHIRSKVRKPADSTTHEMLVDLSLDTEENGPEEELLKSDERQKVREVLATLSPSHRAALALREFEGMSYDDIAVALNMTEPQVKALIHRARKAFKKQWAPGLFAAFLPWRLIARLRKFSTHYDPPPQIGDAAASTVNFATSCSVALQHCGQFVSERIVTSVTALVVGAGAIGVAAIGPSGDPEIKKPLLEQPGEASSIELKLATIEEREKPRRRAQKRRTAVKPEPAAAPVVQPQPATSPTAAPPEPESSAPATQPDDKPKPPPGPAPVFTFFGWQSDQSIPRVEATSSSAAVDCFRSSLTHDVQTFISYGSDSYPLTLRFDVSSSIARLGFSVRKDGYDIRYASWGPEAVATWAREGTRAKVEITGEYGPLYGYEPESVNLPKSGAFNASLTLDCAAQTVVTEGAAFTVE